MKKKISLALLVILSAFMLVACGKQMTDAEKFVGTWVAPPNQCPDLPETDVINWGEKMVVFSDGTVYDMCFLASDPDTIAAEFYWDSYTMENGYLKYKTKNVATGVPVDGVLNYQYVNDDTLKMGGETLTFYYRQK